MIATPAAATTVMSMRMVGSWSKMDCWLVPERVPAVEPVRMTRRALSVVAPWMASPEESPSWSAHCSPGRGSALGDGEGEDEGEVEREIDGVDDGDGDAVGDDD